MEHLFKVEKYLDQWLGKLLTWRNPVPESYREENLSGVLRENLKRLFIASSLMIVVESILYFFEDYFYSTGPAILIFIGLSALLFPPLLYFQVKRPTQHHFGAWLLQTLWLANYLVFGIQVALISQRQGDASYIYLVIAMGVAVYFDLSPFELFAHLLSSYLAFALLLPAYQADPRVFGVLRVNALVVILIAVLIGRMINQMRLRMFLDQKEIAAKNTALERLLMLDQMTQLLNHETAFAMLQHEIKRANRINYPLSMIIFDIDDFKRVNDQYGHVFGDQVIREVAVAMTSSLRQTDLAGRYGGEEFVIILPNTSIVEAMNAAERIQAAIAAINLEKPVKITVSGGVSEFEGESVLEFVNRTDAKLYHAKRTGKNRFISFCDIEPVSNQFN